MLQESLKPLDFNRPTVSTVWCPWLPLILIATKYSTKFPNWFISLLAKHFLSYKKFYRLYELFLRPPSTKVFASYNQAKSWKLNEPSFPLKFICQNSSSNTPQIWPHRYRANSKFKSKLKNKPYERSPSTSTTTGPLLQITISFKMIQ